MTRTTLPALAGLALTPLFLVALPGAAGAETPPTCDGRAATIVATSGTATGTPGDDVIVATGGSVSVDAGAGDDLICIDALSGHVVAGAGEDVVDATAAPKGGYQHADLGPGSDRYLGGPAHDFVDSGPASGTGVPDHDVITTGDNKDDVTVSQPNTDVATQNGKDRLTVATVAEVFSGSLRLGRARDDLRVSEPTARVDVDLRHRRLVVGSGKWDLIGDERAEVVADRAHLVGDGARNQLFATACVAKIVGSDRGDTLAFFATRVRAGDCHGRARARVFGGPGQDKLLAVRADAVLDGGPGLDRAVGHGPGVTCRAERTRGC